MEKDFLKYLNTEREISRFKIDSLKKSLHKNEASTKRLIEIEEEFLSIRFETLANSLSELLSAIKIFRESRTAFSDIYKEKNEESEDDMLWIDKAKSTVLGSLKNIDLDISKSKVKDARNKSRVIAILICFLTYLEKTKMELIKNNISISKKDLIKEILRKYNEDIFSFYNDVILESNNFNFIDSKTKIFLSEIKPLINISVNSDDNFFMIGSKNFKGRRIFGFFIPSKHSGRETLRPYYIRIFDNDGDNISKLFNLNTRALQLNNEYYKFLPLINLSEIKENLVLLDKYENLMKKIFYLKLSGKKDLKVDIEKSTILVPSSRTEDEGIRAALTESDLIISNILTNLI